MSIETDTEFRVVVVASVRAAGDAAHVVMRFADGWSLYARNPDGLPPPDRGDFVRLYGRGIGFPVRGCACGDRVYYYQTAEAFEESLRVEQAARDAERQAKWDAGLAAYDARVLALPPPLQERIAFFRRDADWGWRYGDYELFCCEEAARFAADPDAEPSDGHTGSTLAAARGLATIVTTRPDVAAGVHGAMCALVGCEAYGCYASTEKAAEARRRAEWDAL